MSSVNTKTCKRCGVCVAVCPNRILEAGPSGDIIFNSERSPLCIECGHCMAVCPTKSVQAGLLSYEKDLFELTGTPLSPEEFLHFLQSRRSVRVFRDTPVPSEFLEKILQAVSLAPMGFPPHKVEIKIISDPTVLAAGLARMQVVFEKLLKMMKNPFIRFIIRKKVGEEVFATLRNHLVPILKVRLPLMKQTGHDDLLRGAPVLLLFHAQKIVECHTEDAHIAGTYAMLAAHSLGLGAAVLSIPPGAINMDKDLKRVFQIPDGHEVSTSLIVGYPKHRFLRGIHRPLAVVERI